jgi:PAB1-binding protein PBP1|mmetsp:Transcript_19309/g.26150  ORF Transcript_19309/g.26150 Transcript_19309/m.26150 type:complete len:142 (+) Transcript_19309:260-685(+)
MKQEDEAIISTSNAVPKQQNAAAATSARGQRRGAERALEKTSWLSGASSAALNTLEELDSSMPTQFNQFAGKKTDYSDEHYSTPLNLAAVSKEKQQQALEIERQVMSQVSKNRHLAEERNQVGLRDEEDEEGKYGATDRKA